MTVVIEYCENVFDSGINDVASANGMDRGTILSPTWWKPYEIEAPMVWQRWEIISSSCGGTCSILPVPEAVSFAVPSIQDNICSIVCVYSFADDVFVRRASQ
jgi:hypothetical protein